MKAQKSQKPKCERDQAIRQIKAALREGDWAYLLNQGIEGTSCALAYDAELQTWTEDLQAFLDRIEVLAKSERIPEDIRKELSRVEEVLDAWRLANATARKMFNVLVTFFLSLKPTITLDLSRIGGGR